MAQNSRNRRNPLPVTTPFFIHYAHLKNPRESLQKKIEASYDMRDSRQIAVLVLTVDTGLELAVSFCGNPICARRSSYVRETNFAKCLAELSFRGFEPCANLRFFRFRWKPSFSSKAGTGVPRIADPNCLLITSTIISAEFRRLPLVGASRSTIGTSVVDLRFGCNIPFFR